MELRFSHNFKLPDYLEEVLSPFSWSAIFSNEFRLSIVNVLMATNPVEAVDNFADSLRAISFLDSDYKSMLISALQHYAKEREKGALKR